MEKRRVIISAGGTGGHLFPAQNLARQMTDWEILFVAAGLATNRYFDRTEFRFAEIASSTLSLSKPLHALLGCGKLLVGVIQSWQLLRRFCPDLVIGFGSFFTFPVLLAARLQKVPFLLHEQNAIPGKVNRIFSSAARATAITFPHAKTYLKGETVEVAFPLKSSLNSLQNPFQDMAWDYFGLLKEKAPVLLIFGGSQGAARLNELILQAVSLLLTEGVCLQLLHFTGTEERAEIVRSHYKALGLSACVKAFESHMERAMQIADLSIVRAGAATLSELIAHELPAILIPYPFATDQHQEKNAEHFVSTVKGGTMYKESKLDAHTLARAIHAALLQRQQFKENMILYKQSYQPPSFLELINHAL